MFTQSLRIELIKIVEILCQENKHGRLAVILNAFRKLRSDIIIKH